MNFPILTWLVFLPLLGMLAVMLTPKQNEKLIKQIATVVSALLFLLSLKVLMAFNLHDGGIQLAEKVMWIPQLNVHYYLGIDGISLPMVVLTALLSLLACVASYGIKDRVKEYFALYLLLETGMLGTFLALDLFLFYVFWEVVLVPMYFLIGIWGGPRKEYAAIKFFLYTLAGSLFMLLGILAIYFTSTPQTFDMIALRQNNFAAGFQHIVFLALFLGFAIKVPIWPFHTWLPDAHVEAPTPISVILAGVLLKMGTYGFFRISYPILPEGAHWFAPWMGILAAIGIIYGGFVALAQTDFKKLVAYSSVSHMGFVLLGLASCSAMGMNGALLQMFSHGVLTGALFLLVGALYDRAHTRDLSAFGGLGAVMKVYAGILIFVSMGSLGLPGLSGFVAEFMILLGTFKIYPVITGLSCIGILLAACYMLYTVQRVLLGKVNPKWEKLTDMTGREIFTLAPLMIVTLAIGVYPILILKFMTPAITALVGLLS
ncbi:MAG: oxidoreductase [Candidatus Omnitrophica bacterium CG11_big_fil_rev_8_21_14_0_20_45_26]|uniref:Oxidoreductase n=1 Tax=Candidatus Abzuiibacterium crystallinum TaxID=1974748 RepID=A0A2H0LM40_9BACT|nr:MAG: oxidoreductase [Candidatus Omnitrophica bacterium CG11_big_fil_rev_8_21_14_0_20_45_26]PIW63680.1 MAG: oxidoreductase [Candidatus Omnitrophica bacterium CG12_big_fil_rev_8_21_14_0_65_45_16]